MVRDAVVCHFEDAASRPKIIRLHFVRDLILADVRSSELLLAEVREDRDCPKLRDDEVLR